MPARKSSSRTRTTRVTIRKTVKVQRSAKSVKPRSAAPRRSETDSVQREVMDVAMPPSMSVAGKGGIGTSIPSGRPAVGPLGMFRSPKTPMSGDHPIPIGVPPHVPPKKMRRRPR